MLEFVAYFSTAAALMFGSCWLWERRQRVALANEYKKLRGFFDHNLRAAFYWQSRALEAEARLVIKTIRQIFDEPEDPADWWKKGKQ